MQDNENCSSHNKRTPWNKGKLIGARPPLRPKHVWSIRARLLLEGHYATLSPMAGNFHAAADRPRFFACAESSSVAPSSERRTSTVPAVSAAPSGGLNAKLWRPLPKPARSRSSR